MATETVTQVKGDLRLQFLKKHGIPHKPCSVVHDPVQGLLALAGTEGEIQIMGKAGVEATLSQPGSLPVSQVFFSTNEGILFSLCEADNSVTKWDLKACPPELSGRFLLTGEGITMVSASKPDDKMIVAYLPVGSEWIYIGTEGGNVFLLNKHSLQLSEYSITYEKLSSRARGKWESPGFIVGIEECPANASLILILVSGGWVNLWDIKSNSCEAQFFSPVREVITIGVSWHYSGKQFAAGYTNGSLSIWQLDSPQKPYRTHTSSDLYGMAGNASITRLFWLANQNSKDGLLLFSGGPEGAETTLTVLYSLSSKQHSSSLIAPSVITDFAPISFHPHKDKAQYPHAVALLCREELLVYEIMDYFAWQELPVPTANNLATSLVTAINYIDNCPIELIDTLRVLGEELCYNHLKDSYKWPLNGGTREPEDDNSLLLTGHENGDVRFWDASRNKLELIYYIKSTPLFKSPPPPRPPPPTRSPSVTSPTSQTTPTEESPKTKSLPPRQKPSGSSQTPEAKYDVSKSISRNIREQDWGSFIVIENREGERERELAVSYLKLCPVSKVLCVCNRSRYLILHRLLSVVEQQQELVQLSIAAQDTPSPSLVFNSKSQAKRGFNPHIIVYSGEYPTHIGFEPDCHMVFIELKASVYFLSLETNSLYNELSLTQIAELKRTFFEDRNKRKGLIKTLTELNDSLSLFVETLASEKLTHFSVSRSEISKCYRFFLGTMNGHLVCIPAALDRTLNLSPSFSNPDLIAFDFWDATKRKLDPGPVITIHHLETVVPSGPTGSQERSTLDEFVVVVCPRLVRVSKVSCLDRKKMKNSPNFKAFIKDKIKASYLIKSNPEGEHPSFHLACLLESGTLEILGVPDLSTVVQEDKAFRPYISCDTFYLHENGKGVFLPSPSSIQRICISREDTDSNTCLYNERQTPDTHINTSFFHKGKNLTASRVEVHDLLAVQSERYKYRQEQKNRTHNKAQGGKDAMGKALDGLDEREEKLNLVADRAANLSSMAESYLKNTRAIAEKYK
ncbi:syntaxin-binding protein 5-like [Oopsacas minuta]|uniref:Syntaxin-binding protein 5-like n=1 Tax=Oopsacas minuta TaxID=111878 RepID=A0AAV7JDC8_9METZ|nr:syntaxin-binding protein 5-like [Oopsacas minuta]